MPPTANQDPLSRAPGEGLTPRAGTPGVAG